MENRIGGIKRNVTTRPYDQRSDVMQTFLLRAQQLSRIVRRSADRSSTQTDRSNVRGVTPSPPRFAFHLNNDEGQPTEHRDQEVLLLRRPLLVVAHAV
jgi:hypothetical protein